jgi:predicted nuclease of predicted toxin-antitoxin system
LRGAGWDTRHWSEVGPVNASDADIMAWAKARDWCVITNDLDFSAILAATHADGPSIVQIRGQDLAPDSLGPTLIHVLTNHGDVLASGALVTVDIRRARVRVLPLR